MFKLYGVPLSNFYNIAKLALMEKGLDFQEVAAPPSQETAFLAVSPMGKIPVLEVNEGHLTECQAIVDFLENVYPEIPLFPSDPYARALVKRLCHMAETYLDGPLHPLFGMSIRGETPSEEFLTRAGQVFERGLAAYARTAKFQPWVAGETFSAADIFLYFCLGFVESGAREFLDITVEDHLPGHQQWKAAMEDRDFVRQINREKDAAMEAFRAGRAKA